MAIRAEPPYAYRWVLTMLRPDAPPEGIPADDHLLASWAAKHLSLEQLRQCTLYSSAEPCAMCAGAIYWAGIGRVVFGQSERDLKAQTGAHEENPTLDLPCHVVFAAGQRPTEVVGPLLAEEAAQLQADFWSKG